MALRLTWLPEAIDDLDSIANYIAIDSPNYARNYVARIIARAEGLIDLPDSGHITPEANREDVRELSVYPYRLIYRIKSDNLIVLAVLHGSRLVQDVVSKRVK